MSAPRHPITTRAAAFLCAAAIVAAPSAAQAQFGKLKDLGKKAAASVVEKKVEDEASKKVGGAVTAADPGAAARPRSVEFTDDVLEITDARLAQLSRGVDAEEAARPAAQKRYQARLAAAKEADRTYEARRAAYDREYAAWDKKKTEIEACNDRVLKKYEHAGDAESKRSQELHDKMDAEMTDAKEARLKALADRMDAAQKRGDQATVRVLADSMQREMATFMAAGREGMAMSQRVTATSDAMQKESKACGTVPPAPKNPDNGGYVDADMARREASAAGAKAAGLSERQYAVLRERVEGYARLKGRTGRSSLSYTAGELQALGGDAAKALFAKPGFATTESWSPDGD
ncbi:hypothetical protein [Roseisolibacter sp. H3M3-2]|uniref:hypothetical protein n=1 Tax=Roseisolibacter sp. H3M3-2 TaxID=3031323 RepID=UPI0023D9F69E|nr:hypothetical protein [Roseisolibacter sp. H3M3-2]MDF1504147.1 hypothetical protein [Roseisolibacter sp. H3M3-2]